MYYLTRKPSEHFTDDFSRQDTSQYLIEYIERKDYSEEIWPSFDTTQYLAVNIKYIKLVNKFC